MAFDLPNKLPRWADNGGTISEPSEGKKDVGWTAEKPTFGAFNWLLNLIYNWLGYLNRAADTLLGSQMLGMVLDFAFSPTGIYIPINAGYLTSAPAMASSGGTIMPFDGKITSIVAKAEANQNINNTHIIIAINGSLPVSGTIYYSIPKNDTSVHVFSVTDNNAFQQGDKISLYFPTSGNQITGLSISLVIEPDLI